MSRRGREAPDGAPRWVDTRGGGLEEWEDAGVVGGSTRAQATLTAALRYALWGGLALALVLGLVNCAAPSRSQSPASDDTPAQPVPPPGGCAELVVAAWLAGDTDLLAGVPGIPRGAIEPDRRQALATYTATVTPGQVGWGYVIGAEVRQRDEDGEWEPPGHHFYAVTMIPTVGGCQGWAPAALPAEVGPPVLGGAQAAYPVTLPSSGTELSETLQAFFAGMLAGDGDPERYVAPGTLVPVLSPPPYTEVSVIELRTFADPPLERTTEIAPEGTVLPVLVTVATSDDDLPLVYPLRVGVRGGRWEVLAIEALVGTPATTPPETAAGTAEEAPASTPAGTNGD